MIAYTAKNRFVSTQNLKLIIHNSIANAILKQGEGAKTDKLGRPFYYWKYDKLSKVFG